MPFYQEPPVLANQYDDDVVLRDYLSAALPADMLKEIEPSLREMGRLAGGPLYQLQLEDRKNEPVFTQWDAWGHRGDTIEVTRLWKEAARIASEHGVIATAYERAHGSLSRVHQFALVYLFDASTDVYTCPLAMTDGAARTLLAHGNEALIEHAVKRLTSRDPQVAWTSGQWMTERTGGSDVGMTETIARLQPDGRYRLYGTKWFTSAITSQMALTLARPEGNPPGGRGLALFYVEVNDNGNRNGILVNRLKDKLGTRKVPTAELTLDGAIATLVAEPTNGVRNIAPMLNITRVWNAIGAIASMRRGLALATDYATRRSAFGTPLSTKPLHADTLAGLWAEFEGAFHLTFHTIELLGHEEAGENSESDSRLLRVMTPIAKLLTAKQAVAIASEVLECMGGAGYVEDTGLPRLLRDAQVLPIWEGTTNVLSLDVMRALAKDQSLPLLSAEVARLMRDVRHEGLARACETVAAAMKHVEEWLGDKVAHEPSALETNARRVALTLGRALELALLVRQASWAYETQGSERAVAAARRLAQHGVDQLQGW